MTTRTRIAAIVAVVVAAGFVVAGLFEGKHVTDAGNWARGRGCTLMPEGESRYGLGQLGRCQELKSAGHLFGAYASDYVLVYVPTGSIALRIDFTRKAGGKFTAKATEVTADKAPNLSSYDKPGVTDSIKARGGLTPPFDVTPSS
jgi:hypothetical protein